MNLEQIHPAQTLVQRAADFGEIPTDEQLAEAVPTRGFRNVKEAHQARDQVKQACRRASNFAEAGHHELAANLVEAVGVSLGADPSKLAAAVQDPQFRNSSRSSDYGAWQPLSDLLREVAGTGNTPSAEQLDSLTLDPELTDEQRGAWRSKVSATVAAISKLRDSGQFGPARALASQRAEELGRSMARPEHVDPAAEVTDPRELAEMAHRSSPNPMHS